MSISAKLSLRPLPEAGGTMVEVLVAILLFSIVGLALAQSAIAGMKYQKQTEIGILAKNLAVSKAEQLSGVRIDLLDNSYDSTESNLAVTGHRVTFTRATDITVNADGSRTIQITVSSPSPYLTRPLTYTTRFAPWES